MLDPALCLEVLDCSGTVGGSRAPPPQLWLGQSRGPGAWGLEEDWASAAEGAVPPTPHPAPSSSLYKLEVPESNFIFLLVSSWPAINSQRVPGGDVVREGPIPRGPRNPIRSHIRPHLSVRPSFISPLPWAALGLASDLLATCPRLP